MWDDKEFRAKAKLYFKQAEEVNDNDEYTLLWCTLGLEFLLRAPLAATNPVLLADPANGDGYSILHAAGFAGTKEPISIKTKTVIDRLLLIVEDFDSSAEQDVKFLVGIRNRELHTSWLGLADISDNAWLPKFLRTIRILAAFFNEKPDDYLSAELLAHAGKLTDTEDRRLQHLITERIKECALFATKLNADERLARGHKRKLLLWLHGPWAKEVTCPACGWASSRLLGEPVRYGRETLNDDGDINRRVYIISQKFSCRICGLKLNSVSEIAAAQLEQRWDTVISESITDRFGNMPSEPDYLDYDNN